MILENHYNLHFGKENLNDKTSSTCRGVTTWSAAFQRTFAGRIVAPGACVSQEELDRHCRSARCGIQAW
jgi:hypothetical protein